jgi:hypothetical protein
MRPISVSSSMISEAPTAWRILASRAERARAMMFLHPDLAQRRHRQHRRLEVLADRHDHRRAAQRVDRLQRRGSVASSSSAKATLRLTASTSPCSVVDGDDLGPLLAERLGERRPEAPEPDDEVALAGHAAYLRKRPPLVTRHRQQSSRARR